MTTVTLQDECFRHGPRWARCSRLNRVPSTLFALVSRYSSSVSGSPRPGPHSLPNLCRGHSPRTAVRCQTSKIFLERSFVRYCPTFQGIATHGMRLFPNPGIKKSPLFFTKTLSSSGVVRKLSASLENTAFPTISALAKSLVVASQNFMTNHLRLPARYGVISADGHV